MAGYNRVELMGQLTREPEIRLLPGGEEACCFGVKVSTPALNMQNVEIQEECFVEVRATGTLAKVIQSFYHTDYWIYIDGRLRLETWMDNYTGFRRKQLIVVADTVQYPEPDGEPVREPPEFATGFPPEISPHNLAAAYDSGDDMDGMAF